MSSSTSKVLQFKISLKNFKPEVYRRVLVPVDYTFRDLHFVIQDVFGWSNMHLHKYIVHNKNTKQIEIEIGSEDMEAYTKFYPEKTTKLTEIFKRAEDSCEYVYDFGYPWYHIVLLEDIVSKERGRQYPCCIGGNRRTPQEDCPGEDYDEFSEGWDHFDPSEVVFRDQNEKVDILEMKSTGKERRRQLEQGRHLEQERRDRFRDCYSTLREVTPGSENVTKIQLLDKAVHHIRKLEKEKIDLKKKIDHLEKKMSIARVALQEDDEVVPSTSTVTVASETVASSSGNDSSAEELEKAAKRRKYEERFDIGIPLSEAERASLDRDLHEAEHGVRRMRTREKTTILEVVPTDGPHIRSQCQKCKKKESKKNNKN